MSAHAEPRFFTGPYTASLSFNVNVKALPRWLRVSWRFMDRFGQEAWQRQLTRRVARREAIAEVRLERWMRSLGVEVGTGETMLERIERLREPTLMELLMQDNLFAAPAGPPPATES